MSDENKKADLEEILKDIPGVTVIKKKQGQPVSPDFFRALQDFQYGDSETSEEAFERIQTHSNKPEE